MKPQILLLTPALLLSPFTLAQDDMSDVLGGFDDLDDSLVIDESQIDSDIKKNPWGWETNGSLVLSYAWNYEDHFSTTGTDYKGLSKLRLRANLQADNQLSENWMARVSGYIYHDMAYSLNDRNDYSDEVLDEYETDIDAQEVYLRGKLNEQLDLKLGRQVVIWGNADNVRVLDVLNPLDNLEPGLADIEDLRLPVTMAKLDYYFSGWNLSLIAAPEIRFSKNPPVGSDFNYTTDLSGQPLKLEEEIPDDIKHQNWAAALSGTWNKWDLSLNLARFWRDTPVLELENFDPTNLPAALVTFPTDVYLRHSRVNMVGASAQTTTGSWLFKGEIALFDGYEFNGSGFYNLPGTGFIPLPDRTLEHDQVDAMLGLEYFGIANTTIALEFVNRHIDEFEDSLELAGFEEDETELALRITRSYMNDRLDLTFVTINFNEGDDGSISRIDAKYEIQDGLNATAGILVYGGGETDPLDAFRDNDRIFAELKWSF